MATPPRVGALTAPNNLADVDDIAQALANLGALSSGGGTVTGPLLLTAPPSNPLQAVPVSYVDNALAPVAQDAADAIAIANDALTAAIGGPIVAVGTWNAATNTPTLVSGNGTPVSNIVSRALVVAVAGSTNIDGNASWAAGDAVVWNGTAWFRAPAGSIYAPRDGAVMTNATVSGPSGTFANVSGTGWVNQPVDPRYALLGTEIVYDAQGGAIALITAAGTHRVSSLWPTLIRGSNVPVQARLTFQAPTYGLTLGTDQLSPIDPRYALLGTDARFDSTGKLVSLVDNFGIARISGIALNVLRGAVVDTTASFLFQGASAGFRFGDTTVRAVDPRYALTGTSLIFDAVGAVTQLIDAEGWQRVGQVHAGRMRVNASPLDPLDVANRGYVDSVAASPYLEPKRDFGAVGDGVADDSVPVNLCVAAAIARGDRTVAMDHLYNVPSLSAQVGRVMTRGKGRLINSPIFKFVVPDDAPPPIPPPPTFDARVHCPNAVLAAQTTGVVRIVFTGDSTSTVGIPDFDLFASANALVQSLFAVSNPGVRIEWYNRGIGGGDWNQINSFPTATALPAWYDAVEPWLFFIGDPARDGIGPDVVIVAAARNGSSNYTWQQTREVRAKMALWPKACDLLATNTVGETQENITSNWQNIRNGYEYAANAIRSYFVSQNLGFLDSETMEAQTRFGYAQATMPLLRDGTAWGGLTVGVRTIALPFSLVAPVYGYGAFFRVKVGGWTLMGNEIVFALGQAKTNAMRGSKLFIRRNPTTFAITAEVTATRIADGASENWTPIPEAATGATCDDASLISFQVAVSGSRLFLYFIGTPERVPLWDVRIPRAGGAWTPAPLITCAAGSVPNALEILAHTDNLSNVASAVVMPEMLVAPTLTDPEFASPVSPVLPWGGGGPHPSALAVERIMRPAYEVNRFTF